jgi:TRAP-type C4-dicarboxylate transport system permease small subunit
VRRRLAALSETLGALCLLAVMGLTVADVVLRAIEPTWRIFGIVEMVQLAFDLMIFLTVPAVFLLAGNLTVTVFDGLLPRRGLLWVKRAAAAVSAGFVALLLWQARVPAADTLRYRDETQDLGLPLFVYWAPVLLGLAGALAGALWCAVAPPPEPGPGEQ